MGIFIGGKEASVIIPKFANKPKQTKQVTPAWTEREVIPDSGFELEKVIIKPIQADNYAKPTEVVVVTPSTSAQVITPTEGHTINQVNVNPVDSSIDSNITPWNIQPGVTILGVTGAERLSGFQYVIDKTLSMESMFKGADQETFDAVCAGVNTSRVTNWARAFQDSTITNFRGIDTSGGTNYDYIFANTKDIDLTGIVLNVSWTNSTFQNSKVKKIPANVFPNVISQMSGTFSGCSELETIEYLNIQSFSAGNMNGVFTGCTKLKNLYLYNINITLQIEACESLSKESLLHIAYQLFKDRESELRLHDYVKSMLDDTYVKYIDITDEMREADPYVDRKLPFVECLSTDEGAMTLRTYIMLKSWTIR